MLIRNSFFAASSHSTWTHFSRDFGSWEAWIWDTFLEYCFGLLVIGCLDLFSVVWGAKQREVCRKFGEYRTLGYYVFWFLSENANQITLGLLVQNEDLVCRVMVFVKLSIAILFPVLYRQIRSIFCFLSCYYVVTIALKSNSTQIIKYLGMSNRVGVVCASERTT